jgi:protein TonB
MLALVGSLAVHLGTGGVLAHLAKRPKPPPRPPAVTVSVVEKVTPKPPEPEKPPEPPKPPPPKPVKVARLDRPKPPPDAPPPPRPVAPTDAPPPPSVEAKQQTTPVVLSGITLESTSSAGSFAVNAGNTLYGDPGRVGRDPSTAKPYKAERYAPSAMVSEPATCAWPPGFNNRSYYPPAAKKKEFEGVVILKVLIDGDGSLAKVDLVSDPGEGLGPAAVQMVRDHFKCNGAKVGSERVATTLPVHITFNLD